MSKNKPMSPFPDGDTHVLACPCCGSGEYLYNEDGHRNKYCGQCGQAIDWEEDGSECRPAPGLETASKDRYVLDPTRDQAAAKAMRTYAIVTEDDELYMRILAYLGPMIDPATEFPFRLSEQNIQELFDTAWKLNTSDETRTELSQLVVDRISQVQQDFSCLTEFWKLFSGYQEPDNK